MLPSASLAEVHDKVEVPPEVMLTGLNDAVQVGAGTTVTVAGQVLVPPEPLSTVSVQVWAAVGDLTDDPLAPKRVPLPKFPLQL